MIRHKQTFQAVDDRRAGERFHDARTTAITRRTFAVQIGASGEVGQQAGRRRAGSAYDVRGVRIRHNQAVAVDFVGDSGHSRFQHAVREHIQRQRQILSRELGINVELRRQSNRHARFVEIFNVQSRTRRADETARTANVNGVPDLRTDNRELIVIVTIDFARKSQFVLKHHQCFVRDFADSQQIISHDYFLNKNYRIFPASRACFHA